MNLDKQEAISFFERLYFGKHHFPSKIKEHGEGWEMKDFSTLATFDTDSLTRLVFLAHDECIRVSISCCNMQYIKIILHKRIKRETGSYWERHPTLEAAVSTWRKK